MKKYFIITFLIFSFSGFAQDNRGTIKVKKVPVGQTKTPASIPTKTANLEGYVKVGQLPMFTGGQGEMEAFIKKNLKYPVAEKKARIEGTVNVVFTVKVDGGLINIKVLDVVSGAPGLEKEALRIVSIMPKWTPGMKNGKIAPMDYTIPIKFKL